MLYAFGAQDIGRIRRLLAAYEQGRLLVDTPPAQYPSQAGRQDTILGHVTTAIPAATVAVGPPVVTTAGTGPAIFVKVDYTTGNPVLTDITNTDKVYTVANYGLAPLPIGYYLLAREPTSGNYIPASADTDTWVMVTSLTTTPLMGAVVGYPAVIVVLNSSTGVWNTGATVWFVSVGSEIPTVGDRYQCRYLSQASSGVAIYASRFSADILTWFSGGKSQVPFGGGVTQVASLTLPYIGTYLLTCDISIEGLAGSTLGTLVAVGFLGTSPTAKITATPDTPLVSNQIGNPASLGVGALAYGTGTISILYTTTAANTVVYAYANANSVQSSTAEANFNAIFMSPGALPSATTVNGLTGGVNIAPVSGGGGGAGGGGNTTPAGTVVTVSGTTISIGLSSAAVAAINQFLAGANL